MAKKINNTKRKFTFIDIILVLAILGLAGFVIYGVFFADQNVQGEKAVEVEYQIKVEKIRYEDYEIELLSDGKITSDFLLKNETVYLASNSKEIGKVVSVEYEPYTQSTGEVNELGELIYSEYPGYINILITVQTNAENTQNGYSVSGVDLLMGSEIEFRTQTYFGVANITKISGKGEEQS